MLPRSYTCNFAIYSWIHSNIVSFLSQKFIPEIVMSSKEFPSKISFQYQTYKSFVEIWQWNGKVSFLFFEKVVSAEILLRFTRKKVCFEHFWWNHFFLRHAKSGGVKSDDLVGHCIRPLLKKFVKIITLLNNQLVNATTKCGRAPSCWKCNKSSLHLDCLDRPLVL